MDECSEEEQIERTQRQPELHLEEKAHEISPSKDRIALIAGNNCMIDTSSNRTDENKSLMEEECKKKSKQSYSKGTSLLQRKAIAENMAVIEPLNQASSNPNVVLLSNGMQSEPCRSYEDEMMDECQSGSDEFYSNIQKTDSKMLVSSEKVRINHRKLLNRTRLGEEKRYVKGKDSSIVQSAMSDLSKPSTQPMGSNTQRQGAPQAVGDIQMSIASWVEVDPSLELAEGQPVAVYTATGAPVLPQSCSGTNLEGRNLVEKIGIGTSSQLVSKDEITEGRKDRTLQTEVDESASRIGNNSDKVSKCPKCGKRIANLKSHMKVHNGERPFKCKDCGKAFIEARHLENHSRSHTGERPFACDVCSKTFMRDTNLMYHRRTHTGEKPYSCDICGKSFSRKGDLTVHARTHTGERPFTCPICNKACTTQGNLTLHKRTHSGEKPYSCKFCPRVFKSCSDLTKHHRTHTGEKPFSCKVCQRKFRASSDVTRHMRSHTGEKPHKCPVCLKEFSTDNYLPRHRCTGRKDLIKEGQCEMKDDKADYFPELEGCE